METRARLELLEVSEHIVDKGDRYYDVKVGDIVAGHHMSLEEAKEWSIKLNEVYTKK